MTAGLPPPADLESEARVLGALLYDQRHVEGLPSTLRAESFYSEAHRRVFAAVEELRARGVDVSPTTVGAEIREQRRTAQLPDGEAFLQQLVDATPVLLPKEFDRLVQVVIDKATLRAATQVLHKALARAYGGEAPMDLLGEVEQDLQRLTLDAVIGDPMHVRDAMRDAIVDWTESLKTGRAIGTPTGFRHLDAMCGGMHPGDLIVLGARPGMGKTSFVTAVATHVAKRGSAALLFSLEMPAKQIAARILCSDSGVSLARTRSGALTPQELGQTKLSLSEMRDLGIYIDDATRGRPTVVDIATRSRRLAAQLARKGQKLGLVIVDYLQIVKLRDALVKQRHDLAVGEVSVELKSLAKELGVPVIACAQLNRSVEQRTDKRPGQADLRDSGQIEQDADMILMLYRDEHYNPDTADKGVIEVIVEKQRNGPTGTISVRFDGPTTRVADFDAEGR